MVWAIGRGQSAQCAESSKPKVELNSHTDTCVVGDNGLVIHDHNRPVNVYSYDPKDGHRRPRQLMLQ